MAEPFEKYTGFFRLPNSTRRLAMGAIDSMIDQLGKDCLMVFNPQTSNCPNCFFDPTTGRSSGVYNSTGPAPFTRPPCPVCRGTGKVETKAITSEARFLIEWQPKPWLILPPGMQVPQGLVMTKGWLDRIDDIMQCEYIIIDHKNAKYQSHRFKLWGEPTQQGNIVPARYVVAFWQRAEV